jgi:hypothetical protein
MPTLKLAKPNLTKHPPRSPRVKLGGYVHLPRLIDKARATLAGKNGEYKYDCAMDQHFFTFTGIGHDALLAAVKKSRSDSEVLTWVRAHTKRHPAEITAWSAWLSTHAPGRPEGHKWFSEAITEAAKGRDDVSGFFDLLDLDDFVSFGGKG